MIWPDFALCWDLGTEGWYRCDYINLLTRILLMVTLTGAYGEYLLYHNGIQWVKQQDVVQEKSYLCIVRWHLEQIKILWSSSSPRVATQVLSSAGHMLWLGHLGLPNPLKYMDLGGEGRSSPQSQVASPSSYPHLCMRDLHLPVAVHTVVMLLY